jgi:hypothetical protein
MSDRFGSTGGADPAGGWQPAPRDDKAIKVRKTRRALIALGAIALIAFSAGWNPPTGSVHSFSRASDYNAQRESGCTNSGKGCHGSESSYTDFNTYHKKAKCTTCHKYQGVGCIPCHSNSKNHECEACHDGTVEGSVDRSRLTDPYPRGHYRETTHTAMGTDFEARMVAAENGKASAACGNCHSRDLRKAHTSAKPADKSTYGDTVGCGECHNDTGTNGQVQVLDKWKKRDCESCHAEKSAAPMHDARVAAKVETSGTASCAKTGSGCHEGNDIHALHPDAPKNCSGSADKGEPACHDLKAESLVPTATACGGKGDGICHTRFARDGSGHKNESTAHSPKTNGPASDTSYHDTPCGSCHRMAPDGRSLIAEHDLSTSVRSRNRSNGCRNCHDAPASADAIANRWEARDTAESCSACHGAGDLPDAHTANLIDKHTKASAGCASTGAGCHPTSDLSEVGVPTVSANIHKDCLRCHDWRKASGDLAYDPQKSTCGAGRGCHAAKGAYDPKTSVHAGKKRTDGADSAHQAGTPQRDALLLDAASGVATPCDSCHSMALGTEHVRPNSVLASGAGNACTRCHDKSIVTSRVVKASWPERATDRACASCHGAAGGVALPHQAIGSVHQFTELAPGGVVTPGYCSRADCHGTTDVRVIHKNVGCANAKCHSATGDIVTKRLKSCGGGNDVVACHSAISATNHVAHSADLTGTVEGITYRIGANNGCFGCHANDLRAEHSDALVAGSMEGKPANACRVCHAGPGQGAYASLPAVKAAIASHDRRCVACHKSGTSTDGPDGVASPHKVISALTTLPAGAVWSDPFDDWKASFDATTGGGHNVLTADQVGATKNKRYPLTEFNLNGKVYTWPLPANRGSTAWLKASMFGTQSVDTTVGIQHITITCQDCHVFPDGIAGPQGASVKVRIDPAYSQTEYANPAFGKFQFNATGTDRVICYKCHNIYVGANEGTSTVGGNPIHNSHKGHTRYLTTNPQYYGDKCADCHLRIPHAWKRPRLLIRTVVTTDGAAPDAYPYVRYGHNGLKGVRLMDMDGLTTTQYRASCVAGSCYPNTPTSHPTPAMVPGYSYWP